MVTVGGVPWPPAEPPVQPDTPCGAHDVRDNLLATVTPELDNLGERMAEPTVLTELTLAELLETVGDRSVVVPVHQVAELCNYDQRTDGD